MVIGNLYGVLSDSLRSVGKLAARPGNSQSGNKTAKCSIQVVVVHFWCPRNHQPGYQTFPIQVVIVFLRCAICWSLWRKPGMPAVEGCSEGPGLTWYAFKSILAFTANQDFCGRVRIVKAVQEAALCMMHHVVCSATLRLPAMSSFIERQFRPH